MCEYTVPTFTCKVNISSCPGGDIALLFPGKIRRLMSFTYQIWNERYNKRLKGLQHTCTRQLIRSQQQNNNKKPGTTHVVWDGKYTSAL